MLREISEDPAIKKIMNTISSWFNLTPARHTPTCHGFLMRFLPARACLLDSFHRPSVCVDPAPSERVPIAQIPGSCGPYHRRLFIIVATPINRASRSSRRTRRALRHSHTWTRTRKWSHYTSLGPELGQRVEYSSGCWSIRLRKRWKRKVRRRRPSRVWALVHIKLCSSQSEFAGAWSSQ